MSESKALTLSKINYASLAKLAFLLATAIVSPLFFSQPITGSFVNMTLFLAVYFYGFKKEAIAVAVMPSLVAVACGQLLWALAPMVPFIMLSNLILMAVFVFIYRKYKNFLAGIMVAAFIKFVWLYATSHVLIFAVLHSAIAAKVAVMMSWPQLATAVAGGLMAYLAIKVSTSSSVKTRD